MSSNRNKGEDIYAYTRILKYRNKRSGMSIKDLIFLFLSLIIFVSISLFLINYASERYSTLMFVIFLFYFLFLILAFIDYAAGLAIFKGSGILSSAILLLVSIVISIIFTFTANNIFSSVKNQETLAFYAFLNFLFISIVTSYFLMSSSPNRQDREQMIRNLNEIKQEITKISISQLGVAESLDRSIKWLQFQQNDERIWGIEQPMLETAEILRVFFEMGKDLGYSWKDIKGGEEDIHKLEQTYYLLLDTIEKAKIEPETSVLSTLITVGMVNPENLSVEVDKLDDTEKQVYRNALKIMLDEYYDELKNTSEWDFINDLENLNYRFNELHLLPKIILFSRIFHIIGNKDAYFRCGEIMSETFNILINRSDSRFNAIEQKEISNYLLGLMYNTLNILLRKPTVIGEDIKVNINVQEEIEEEEDNLPGLSLPSFDDFDFDDDVNLDMPEEKMKLSVSMAAIRNLIKKKQEIDGSWSARIDTTAECLISVLDRESVENDYIKMAAHYLLALQDKNGSWQNDALLTAHVVKALSILNKSIGGFGL